MLAFRPLCGKVPPSGGEGSAPASRPIVVPGTPVMVSVMAPAFPARGRPALNRPGCFPVSVPPFMTMPVVVPAAIDPDPAHHRRRWQILDPCRWRRHIHRPVHRIRPGSRHHGAGAEEPGQCHDPSHALFQSHCRFPGKLRVDRVNAGDAGLLTVAAGRYELLLPWQGAFSG